MFARTARHLLFVALLPGLILPLGGCTGTKPEESDAVVLPDPAVKPPPEPSPVQPVAPSPAGAGAASAPAPTPEGAKP